MDTDEVLETKKISSKRSASFLLELANLKHEPASVDRFLSKFPEFFPSRRFQREKQIDRLARAGELKGHRENATPEKMARANWFILEPLQIGLRTAWGNTDQRVREWKIFQLRQHFWMDTTRDASLHYDRDDEVPPPFAFEQAMVYFLRKAELTKVCENDACPARYYFASRRSQKYCTDHCAAPAKRAAKLRWWNENRRETED
jgi:hypothetical protein